ncbi:N-6 DNA methylase [Chroococcidiopsis sp. FACHB-1243]|uniref:HsdM family class I SAM-dependent methyltransferase n=1 Tax=Chroococcidiopsis sp. [FACHB-1243] TaxID=2692781 RepID=UPI0017872B09|nr:N-6 DNA methylase [Chroococcidiopsis sp. [FACHB-1243]]MBD2306575.1 N-6 DNA methylase [Chroococcidiopsis sp. [FACHB-1243]]
MAKRHHNQKGNLQSLFLRIEELVLANSGEDEFEEVFKLLIAKLWDERSQQSKFHRYSTDEATFEAITKLMQQAEKEWSGVLDEVKSKLTPEHLSICVDAISKHTISNDSFDVIDSFFEFIVSKSAKGSKGQYFTPRHVVELCVRILQPASYETVLDPACGSGGFLLHTLSFVRKNEGLDSVEELQRFCSEKLWGFDIDARATRVAKALMLLAGDGSSNIIRLNSLLKSDMVGLFNHTDEPNLTIEDVCRCRMKRHKGFDVILTNPPFAGEIREKHFLNCYTVANKKHRVERDILFIERCLELLKPGGRLAIVLPHNKFAGNSFEFLREWILKKARVLAVIGLGRHTFLPHTHQKASILFLQKNRLSTKITVDYNIFFAISEKDGKNSKGQFILRETSSDMDSVWDAVNHDFSEIAENFARFLIQENIKFGEEKWL